MPVLTQTGPDSNCMVQSFQSGHSPSRLPEHNAHPSISHEDLQPPNSAQLLPNSAHLPQAASPPAYASSHGDHASSHGDHDNEEHGQSAWSKSDAIAAIAWQQRLQLRAFHIWRRKAQVQATMRRTAGAPSYCELQLRALALAETVTQALGHAPMVHASGCSTPHRVRHLYPLLPCCVVP